MVYLFKKTIHQKIYLYLGRSARIKGKAKRVWQKYLGPEDTIESVQSFSFTTHPKVQIVSFGLPVALMQIVDRLDLISIINQVVPKRQQGLSNGHYLTLAALNRCIKP